MFNLSRQSRRRPTALDNDDDQWNLCHHRQSEELSLQSHSGSGRDRHRRLSGIGSPDRETYCGNLIFRFAVKTGLSSKEAAMRLASVRVLGDLGDGAKAHAADLARMAKQDPDAQVRTAAAELAATTKP